MVGLMRVQVTLVTLSGGTAHVPEALDSNGRVLHESTSSALYLLAQGVPPDRVLREWASYDTIGIKP